MNLPRRSTVYDRAQKTGFVSGPNVRAKEMMQRAEMAETEPESEEEEGEEPPNYRAAPACLNCAHFDPERENTCTQFDYPAESDRLCDEYESDSDQSPEQEYGDDGEAAQAG